MQSSRQGQWALNFRVLACANIAFGAGSVTWMRDDDIGEAQNRFVCSCDAILSSSRGDMICHDEGIHLAELSSTFFTNAPGDGDSCLIFRPRSEEELIFMLQRLHSFSPSLSISIRNGGHHPAGWSRLGQAIVDLSYLRGVSVDEVSKTVRVMAGERWRSVYHHAHNVTAGEMTVNGAVGYDVGVAGISLVGGITTLSGRFGRVSEGIISARLVTLNGSVLDLHKNSTDYDSKQLLSLLRQSGGLAALPIGVLSEVTFALVAPEIDAWTRWEITNTFESIRDASSLLLNIWHLRKQHLNAQLGVVLWFHVGCSVNVSLMVVGAKMDVADFALSVQRVADTSQVLENSQLGYVDFISLESTIVSHRKCIDEWWGDHLQREAVMEAISDLIGELETVVLPRSRCVAPGTQAVYGFEDWGQVDRSGERTVLASHMVGSGCRPVGEIGGTSRTLVNVYRRTIARYSSSSYLGYTSSPSYTDVFKAIDYNFPGAVSMLQCYRWMFSSAQLLSSVVSPIDVQRWYARQSTVNLEGPTASSHLRSCSDLARPKGPVIACTDRSMRLLELRRIVVVGGTGSIGQELSLQLGELGAEVFIVARNSERCDRLAHEAWGTGGYMHCDLVDLDNRTALRNLARRLFHYSHPPPDALIFAAASSDGTDLWTNHLSSLYLACQLLQRHSRATIIAISSGLAYEAQSTEVKDLIANGRGQNMYVDYRASKRAQAESLQYLQQESGAYIRLVFPTVTVDSSLVKSQLSFQPQLHQRINFGSVFQAVMPVIDAVLRGTGAITGVDASDVPRVQDARSALPQICLQGCLNIECPGSQQTMASTWASSKQLLAVVFA